MHFTTNIVYLHPYFLFDAAGYVNLYIHISNRLVFWKLKGLLRKAINKALFKKKKKKKTLTKQAINHKFERATSASRCRPRLDPRQTSTRTKRHLWKQWNSRAAKHRALPPGSLELEKPFSILFSVFVGRIEKSSGVK